jgi:hypothetical protein
MRRWKKAGLAVLLGGAATLAGMEVHRRSEVAGESVPLVDDSAEAAAAPAKAESKFDPKALLDHYQEPEDFAKLCRELKTRVIEIADREKNLAHTETILAIELDAKGKEIDGEDTVEYCWYDDKGLQVRRQVQRQPRSKKKKPLDPSVRTMPKAEATFPFSREEKPDSYRYTLEGVEEIEGKPALRIHYEPNPPLDGKMRGSVWADPQTFEPVRYEGVWAKLPPLVDQVSTRFDYGPSNTGQTQIKRVIIAGSGGFAMLQKRFRIDTKVHDYRPNKPQ